MIVLGLSEIGLADLELSAGGGGAGVLGDDFAVPLAGISVFFLIFQCPADAELGLIGEAIVGISVEELVVENFGFGVVALLGGDLSQFQERDGGEIDFRFGGEGELEMRFGLVELVLLGQTDAGLIMGPAGQLVVGVLGEKSIEGFGGFGGLAEFFVSGAEAIEGDGNGFAIG